MALSISDTVLVTAGMTVGGLARHAATEADHPVTLDAVGPDDEANVSIRAGAHAAVDRRGKTSVARSLSRPQRAPDSISGF